ncbi:MAG: 50S ribosomal protein L32 [Candidatus Levybacteria bacterium RIFCSPHIGHO2_02_FULL_37_18]|nr:MAG: 50S ribosomal protein L32 [Candidatus Levybacteria bacterium RIFCSPHIGHO2_01_FULL_38_12]OGH22062.1 MAG: 50S ribosomal protein L32 [Candidatus Levybacteria bacterium RIFCSPHIGHO2_02_FULL_37_18]
MPQEPKKRHSRARQGKRRAHIKMTLQTETVCSNCGSKILFHRVCKNCGYYKGKAVIQKKTRNEKSS